MSFRLFSWANLRLGFAARTSPIYRASVLPACAPFSRHRSTLFSPKPVNPTSSSSLLAGGTSGRTIPELTPNPLVCWIDAATSSELIAVVVGNNYKLFRLKKGWKVAGQDISWLESIAFELLACVLIAEGHTGRIIVNSDSRIAIKVFDGHMCRAHPMRECAERLQAGQSIWPFKLETQWVGTKSNLADPFSRGKLTPGFRKINNTLQLTESLARFVDHV